jgi:hypothetical protein
MPDRTSVDVDIDVARCSVMIMMCVIRLCRERALISRIDKNWFFVLGTGQTADWRLAIDDWRLAIDD